MFVCGQRGFWRMWAPFAEENGIMAKRHNVTGLSVKTACNVIETLRSPVLSSPVTHRRDPGCRESMRGPLHVWPLTVLCSGLKNWFSFAIIALPSASSFAVTTTANPTHHRHDSPKRLNAGPVRLERSVQPHYCLAHSATYGVACRTIRSMATRRYAVAVGVEEKVEEKRARLPEWELIADHAMFDKLQDELTRYVSYYYCCTTLYCCTIDIVLLLLYYRL